jgi:carbon storage regulator CsrA
MLVLSRKLNEQIKIGSQIVLTILEVRGSRVVLGIDAPRAVSIWRAELAPFDCELTNEEKVPEVQHHLS